MKRIILIILVFVLLLCTTIAFADQIPFSDISQQQWNDSIKKAYDLGIVQGYDNGKFQPNAPITRVEFAVMLQRTLKLSDEKCKFTDVPGWARGAVGALNKLGIIQGCTDTKFEPNQQLTR